MDKTATINVVTDNDEIIIRHGEAAPPILPRQKIEISGTLATPFEALSKMPKRTRSIKDEFGDTILDNSCLLVSRDQGAISFVENVGMENRNKYIGSLQKDPAFEKFGINSGKSYSSFELARQIKMNRTHFDKIETAMKLVESLMSFEAKVNSDIKRADDNRGNITMARSQAVKSNLPEDFDINIRIFKGMSKEKIKVEVEINPQDLSCTLVSPEAADIEEMVKEREIDKEIERIKELYPTLRIFEV